MKRAAPILLVAVLALLPVACTQHKEGLSGPSINTDEPSYHSGIERSKDQPQVEREARVDFFKVRNSF